MDVQSDVRFHLDSPDHALLDVINVIISEGTRGGSKLIKLEATTRQRRYFPLHRYTQGEQAAEDDTSCIQNTSMDSH